MTMRNRKSIIVAFMLIACMLFAVGFAALNDTLDIEGDMEVSHTNAQTAFDEEVYFSNVSTGSGYTAEILTTNPDKGNFTITGLAGKDDTVSITFTIQNDNDFAVSCVLDPVNTNESRPEYFKVETNVGSSAFEVAANGTYDVVITVTLLQTPQLSEGQTISGSYNVQYDVTDVVSLNG